MSASQICSGIFQPDLGQDPNWGQDPDELDDRQKDEELGSRLNFKEQDNYGKDPNLAPKELDGT